MPYKVSEALRYFFRDMRFVINTFVVANRDDFIPQNKLDLFQNEIFELVYIIPKRNLIYYGLLIPV